MLFGQIFNPNLGPGPGPGPGGPRWAGFGENQKDAQRNSVQNGGRGEFWGGICVKLWPIKFGDFGGYIYGYIMDNPWIIHGLSMDNPWIIHGLSMDYPWIIHGYIHG